MNWSNIKMVSLAFAIVVIGWLGTFAFVTGFEHLTISVTDPSIKVFYCMMLVCGLKEIIAIIMFFINEIKWKENKK